MLQEQLSQVRTLLVTALFVRRPAVRSSLPKSFFALSKPLLPCRNGEQFPPSSVTYAYFASKGESPYLFATCSVQSALKDFPPCIRLLIVCRPSRANNWLRNISTALYLPTTGYLFLSSFYTFLLLFFILLRVGGTQLFSAEEANLISSLSLSLSFNFLTVSFSFPSFPFVSSYNEADSVTSILVEQFIYFGHRKRCSAQEKRDRVVV